MARLQSFDEFGPMNILSSGHEKRVYMELVTSYHLSTVIVLYGYIVYIMCECSVALLYTARDYGLSMYNIEHTAYTVNTKNTGL